MDFKVFRSIGFSMVAIAFSIFIFILYISKHRERTLANYLFMLLIIFNIVSCVDEFLHVFSIYKNFLEIYQTIFCKLHAVSLIIRYYTIIAYIIATVANRKGKRKSLRILMAIIIIIGIINALLPILPQAKITILTNNYLYDYSSNLVTWLVTVPFAFCAITIFGLFLSKVISKKEFLPLAYGVGIVFLGSALQVFCNVDANYQNYLLTILSLAFYFTTENQDVALIENLTKKQEETTKIANEQNEVVISTTSQLKNQMNTIMALTDMTIENKNISKDEIKSDMFMIHESAVNLENIINNIIKGSEVRNESIPKEEKGVDAI